MKKRGILAFLLMISLLLGGCVKGIPAEEAAPLFMDYYIFQKEKVAFNENFANGEELGIVFTEQQAGFKTNFIAGLLQADEVVSQEQADEIYQVLSTQVIERATYEIKQVSTAEGLTDVVYEIYGVSLEELLLKVNQELVARIVSDNSLVKNQAKMVEETMAILKEQLTNVSIKDEPVTVTLQLKQEQGKWQVVNGQSEALKMIYFAFYTGVSSQEQFVEEVTEAMMGEN